MGEGHLTRKGGSGDCLARRALMHDPVASAFGGATSKPIAVRAPRALPPSDGRGYGCGRTCDNCDARATRGGGDYH